MRLWCVACWRNDCIRNFKNPLVINCGREWMMRSPCFLIFVFFVPSYAGSILIAPRRILHARAWILLTDIYPNFLEYLGTLGLDALPSPRNFLQFKTDRLTAAKRELCMIRSELKHNPSISLVTRPNEHYLQKSEARSKRQLSIHPSIHSGARAIDQGKYVANVHWTFHTRELMLLSRTEVASMAVEIELYECG